MSRRWLLFGALTIAVAAGVALRAWSDPKARETRRVERRVLGLAEALTFTEGSSLFSKAAYPDQVAGFFADRTELDLVLGTREVRNVFARDELRERATLIRATTRGLSVQFMDVVVSLGDPITRATAHLTSKVFVKGDADYVVQEFRLHLEDIPSRGWCIQRIETVETLE